MTREQFLQALRRYARKNDLPFRVEKSRGKGSHITVFVGDRFAILKADRIERAYIRVVLNQLGLTKDAV